MSRMNGKKTYAHTHCMENVVLLGGCPGRILGDLLRKTTVSGAKSGSSTEIYASAPTAVGVYGKRRPHWDRQKRTIATSKISTCCEAGSALFTMVCTYAHVPSMTDTYTELVRGPWATGSVWRVMTVRLNVVMRNNEERSWAPKRFPWHRAT